VPLKGKHQSAKKSSLEGEESSGANMKYTKSSAVLPLRVAASSRNPINWVPMLTRSFIKGCSNSNKIEKHRQKRKIRQTKEMMSKEKGIYIFQERSRYTPGNKLS
jgi:hypothetical protein